MMMDDDATSLSFLSREDYLSYQPLATGEPPVSTPAQPVGATTIIETDIRLSLGTCTTTPQQQPPQVFAIEQDPCESISRIG